jgi:uncharacterized protein YyaL (SSP411 family)
VLTSWNALAVRAYAEAGTVLGRDDYVDIARSGADFLLRELVHDGIVLRTWMKGEAKITGFLEDVAFLGDALLSVYEATGDPRYFQEALRLAGDIVVRFYDPDLGYCDTAVDAEPLLVRPRSLDDNPIPAGQSITAQLFLRLSAFTGEEPWRTRALEILTPLASAVARVPLALANVGAAIDLALASPREIAVSGDRGDPATRALLDVVWSRYDPTRVLAWGEADGVPLLEGRHSPEGRPAAYVCERFVCRLPVDRPEALREELDRVPAQPRPSGV